MPAPKLSAADREWVRGITRRIQQRMLALDLSGNRLAQEIGVSQSAVSEWWTQHSVPSLTALRRLPKLLGCNWHWLMTGEEPWEPQGHREEPDIAAIRGGLAAVSEVDQAVGEIRHRLLGQHEAHLQRASARRVVKAAETIHKARGAPSPRRQSG